MLTEKRLNALPRHDIARGKTNLSRLFARGIRLKGGALMMITLPILTEQAGRGASIRALFPVGKRQVPKAVERNRIRRLVREAYRLEKSALDELGDCDASADDGRDRVLFLAILYRGGVATLPSLGDLREEMRRMLQSVVRTAAKMAPDGDV